MCRTIFESLLGRWLGVRLGLATSDRHHLCAVSDIQWSSCDFVVLPVPRRPRLAACPPGEMG